MGYGERYTDKKISAVNRELRKTYRTAQAELKKKLADFEKRFAEQNKKKKAQLAAGKISEQDYRDWLTGRIFVRNQWQANIRQVCQVMQDSNKQAMNIVNTSRFDVFAENYNFNAWQAEKAINVSFSLYNAESVARLINGDPQLLPEWKVNEQKDYLWNQKKVNNIIRQGIIQGEGIPEITARLCRDLATSNESKMRMFARTALGSAQSAGRQKQMEDAAAMGIEVHKRWMAAHDQRTRDAHRDLDGQEVPYDKPFKSELGEIMFPKDPTAEPANVYNCRCVMVTIYPKYEDRSVKYGEGEIIDGQTYEEWKKGKIVAGDMVKDTGKEGKGVQSRAISDELFNNLDYDGKIKEIKQRIAENKDEWNEKSVSQIGSLVRATIEDRTAALAMENAGLISEKERLLENAVNKYDASSARLSELQQLRKQEKYGSKEYKSLDRKVQAELKKLEVLETEKQEAYEAFKKVRADKSTAAFDVLSSLRKMGGVTNDNLNHYVSFNMQYGSSWEKQIVIDGIRDALNKYPTSWLEQSNKHKPQLYPVLAAGRQSYNADTGVILISEVKKSNNHEVAHRMEHCISKILELEKEFYERRTKGCPIEVIGFNEKGEDEYGRKDDFVVPYIGKEYNGEAYEVLSVGYSTILDDYAKLEKDTDILDFILGVMATVD